MYNTGDSLVWNDFLLKHSTPRSDETIDVKTLKIEHVIGRFERKERDELVKISDFRTLVEQAIENELSINA
jgi:hypothetical protein